MHKDSCAILHTVDDVLRLDQMDIRPSTHIVATSARAYYTALAHGRRVVPAHTFVSRSELDQLAESNASRIPALVTRLDAALHAAIPNLPSPFRPFEAASYQLKHFLDTMCFSYAELTSVRCNLTPREFVCLSEPCHQPHDLHPFTWSAEASLFGHLLLAEEGDYQTGLLSKPETQPTSTSMLLDSCRRLINPHIVRALRGNPLRHWINRRNRGVPKVIVLELNSATRRFLRAQPVDPIWWTDFCYRPASAAGVLLNENHFAILSNGKLLAAQEAVSAELAREGLPAAVNTIVTMRVESFIQHRVPRLEALFRKATNYARTESPNIALCGATVADTTQVVASALATQATTLVAFQHGGNYGYVELRDLGLFDLSVPGVFCTFGPGVTDVLARGNGKRRPVVVTVGWPEPSTFAIAAPAVRVRPKARLQLTYIATGLTGNYRYGPRYWYGDTAYCTQLMESLEFICKRSDLTVRLKLHYKDKGLNPLPEVLKQKGWNISVDQTPGLERCLRDTDVVLIDWPSTTLLEVLIRRIPLVYIDLGWLEWRAEAERILKKACWWVERGGDWQREITDGLRRIRHGLVRDDTGFQERYASERYAADAVWQAISRRNPKVK